MTKDKFLFISRNAFVLKSILYDTDMTTPAFFTWYILTFLYFKALDIYVKNGICYFFKIKPDNFCVLIWVFILFAFE